MSSNGADPRAPTGNVAKLRHSLDFEEAGRPCYLPEETIPLPDNDFPVPGPSPDPEKETVARGDSSGSDYASESENETNGERVGEEQGVDIAPDDEDTLVQADDVTRQTRGNKRRERTEVTFRPLAIDR